MSLRDKMLLVLNDTLDWADDNIWATYVVAFVVGIIVGAIL